MPRSITITISDNGDVQGDYDDRIALWPERQEGESGALIPDCQSILDQGLCLLQAEPRELDAT